MSPSVPLPAARRPAAGVLALLFLSAALLVWPIPAGASGPPDAVRFATFNASLNRNLPGQALTDLSTGTNAQAKAVAEIVQRIRPEVLLINEFDYIAGPVTGNALTAAFQNNYLSVPQQPELTGIEYEFVFVAPSNTGISSGFDLNNNGAVVTTPLAPGYGDDALGFGEFPGKFGMAVFSQHPIDYDAARTFQNFKWKDMPDALLPTYPPTWPVVELRGMPWYTDAELGVLPLSSKSHWDIPIDIGGAADAIDATTVHFLVSHPTPPVFDGAEDRNGKRNFDEIRLWADYITPGAGDYIYDDERQFGGLKPGEKFVIAGDQNSDPLDGDSIPGSIQQLLDNPRINTTVTPSSVGGTQWSSAQGFLNTTHESDPAFDTADFCDTPVAPPCSGPGNLRADYVLPSRNLRITDSAVFWPEPGHPLVYLTGTGFPVPSSDHRLVWVDVMVPGSTRN